MYFYSAKKNGFYNKNINDVLPDDAVAISKAKYDELLAAQYNDSIITSDGSGYPIAVSGGSNVAADDTAITQWPTEPDKVI
ncbi:hypothetical protein KAT72_22180 [Aeromonas popoffii]|uniref:Uncharacterized protein n=1 Tax=Aeromonas popoffii TaxID=70856 RepID=A0ABS5GWT2_9GAMM|nr:hypothetical protein [Aeromonas popoffii]MBR7631612.1 hypothetical protein [Aeromonas popoffii]